jgi:uncharacterized integral membrane protein
MRVLFVIIILVIIIFNFWYSNNLYYTERTRLFEKPISIHIISTIVVYLLLLVFQCFRKVNSKRR